MVDSGLLGFNCPRFWKKIRGRSVGRMDNEEIITAAEKTAEDDLFSGAMNLLGN